MTPYALQKLTGEFYCRQFTDLYGFEAVALRYFNVFGQLQNPKSLYSAVIPKFCDSIFSGGAPTIFGDGEQTRDFIFIEDVVAANLAAATHPNAAGNVFNIASGQRLSLNDLILQLGKVLGKKIEAKYEPKRDGDIRHSVADISFAKQHLGFQSQTSFLDGLKKYVNWFEQQR
jgi:nucleoside-diphosphate-sugar epimerase